jgi:transposase
MPKHKYTPEFKSEVLALCQTGDRSCAQVSRDLGINYITLMSWLQAAKASQPVPLGGLSVSESDEIKCLRKENDRLRMERDILIKATAFFASQNP